MESLKNSVQTIHLNVYKLSLLSLVIGKNGEKSVYLRSILMEQSESK